MVTVTELRAENFKRVKAVQIEPAATGLTVLGGNNNQGKTSVLDAIAWALGGDRFRPSQAKREGSVIPPDIQVRLSNGLVVERNGKNSSLKVIDTKGNRAGQQLLNTFIETFALDLPRFMSASGKEKAQTLLKIIGVGDRLFALERQENELYQERLAVGRIADQKKMAAKEMTFWEGLPEEPVSASELIRQQQDILARNGENARKRARKEEIRRKLQDVSDQIKKLQEQHHLLAEDFETACRDAEDLRDESTEELEANIRRIDEMNAKIRTNMARTAAEQEAKNYGDQYDGLTAKIEDVRKQRIDLLNGADMPLPGLSVQDGELTYNGQAWDNMSGSEQLKVSTAIVRRLNPECGFVLLDKLEQMDLNTLKEFGEWLRQEGLQAIATRVSTGDECSIIIEDGMVKAQDQAPVQSAKPTWQKGVF